MRRTICLAALVLVVLGLPAPAPAGMLETETVRFLPAGHFKFAAGYEYQTSPDGSESALPLEFEWGISDRLEFALEPVANVRIAPKGRAAESGMGDTEATLLYLVRQETAHLPALAIAGEVKLPTARKPAIGTRQTDFATFLIASKRFGALDTHVNLGYTRYGKSSGASADTGSNNSFSVALAAVFARQDWQLFGELYSNALNGGGADTADNVIPNASPAASETGGETVGTLGIARAFRSGLKPAFSVSHDNNGATLMRLGVEYRF